ncbi:MGMT family protein [Marinobacterium mangrovicola]|uniref:O(6)-alkylguanine repair protein YbaZ n=1 Tax=Marinobacterium mangrovicola TaxID=1476959 RepID=A0A4R1GQU3_9GAMM|nr:MGMT family protein [Marinobacterium mangrovicola]TCK08509.1 O(6)-alkylguanine repair protein YbaZ [Marinobacterium mangrovicola]
MEQDNLNERIWQVVAAIPKGKVATYGQVAALAGAPRHARYVGTVLKRLPAGSTLPWFRVLNARGELSFPKDSPAYQRQREALEAEGVEFIGARVSLASFGV